MATIEVRRNEDGTQSYRVKVRLKGFQPVSETFDRKTDAKAWGQKTEAAMKEGRFFPERRKASKTVAELVDRYTLEVAPEKKRGDEIARLLAWWKAEHGHRVLAELTPEALTEIRDKLGAKPSARGKGGGIISGATVNRYMGALSQALSMAAREWGWIADNPVRRVTRRKESRGRVRMLSDDERERLLAACRVSGAWYLEPVALLALSTGMRRGEILGLRWPDVDLARKRLVLHDTKNGERRGVALVGPAAGALSEVAKRRRIDTDLVFPGTGSFEHSWGRAVRKAGLEDFRFHDLRHTAASYLAMNGASPSEIAAVLGHKTLAMVKRYAHLHDAHVEGVLTRMADKFLSGIAPSVPRASAEGAPAAVVSLDSRRKKRAASTG